MSEASAQPDPSPDPNSEEQVQPLIITMPDDPASAKDWYLWAAVLALLALVAFWPAIDGGYLWDDDQYVTQNKALDDAAGLKEIWKIPPGTIQYYPLTFTMLWVEHQFWSDNALGYRVVNLLLHAGAAVVLWRLLRRLSLPGAWAAAAIWAVHPLQAESVCWISECKNVLSGFLAISFALFYLEFAGMRDPDSTHRVWKLTDDWQTYLIAAALFLLAMLAKTVVVFAPIAVLAVLWWKRRLSVARVVGVLPMLIIGGALALETSHLETNPAGPIAASGPDWQFSFVQRILISGRDIWFYLGKLLLPVNQSFIYPRVLPDVHDSLQWVYVIATVVVLAGLALSVRGIGRGPLTAAICYLALLFPALGFFDVYPFRFSFVADHFQYLAGIPIVVLAVWIAAKILEPLWRKRATEGAETAPKSFAAIAVVIAALLIVLGTTSWVRATVFADQSSLWQDTVAKNPDSWMADYNLAKIRQSDASSGFDDAAHFAQEGDKDNSQLTAKEALSRLDDSDRLLDAALANPATPNDVRYKALDQYAENDITRMRSPDSDAMTLLQHAENQLQTALKYEAAHDDPLPFYTLGIVEMNQAQELQKKLGDTTRQSAGVTAARATTRPFDSDEQRVVDLLLNARDEFRKAGEIADEEIDSPTVGPEAANVRPLAALQSGNIDWAMAAMAHQHFNHRLENQYSRDAVMDYERAVQFNPNDSDNRFKLALAMENVGDMDDAKEQLMVILRDLNHYDARAYNEIGRVILESGPTSMEEVDAAIESFRDAIQLNPNLTEAQRNLALALKMKASAHPATRSTTGPATMPGAATMP